MLEIDIEKLLIWAFRDQLAGDLIGRGVGLHAIEREAAGLFVPSSSTDGVASLLEINRYGCRIQGGGGGTALSLHPDAEAVHDAVLSLKNRKSKALVIRCARTAMRPDWQQNAHFRMVPVLKSSVVRKKQQVALLDNLPANSQGDMIRTMAGKGLWPERIYDDNRHLIGHRVTVMDHPDHTTACRMMYGEWYAGLIELTGALKFGLRDHVVMFPAVSAAPWLSKNVGSLRGTEVA